MCVAPTTESNGVETTIGQCDARDPSCDPHSGSQLDFSIVTDSPQKRFVTRAVVILSLVLCFVANDFQNRATTLSKVQKVFRKAAECARPVRLETLLGTARSVPTPLYLKIFWILLN